MALTKDDLSAIEQILDKKLDEKLDEKFDKKLEEKLKPIEERLTANTQSIMTLENKVMHELKLLNENLPDVIARHEELNDLQEAVDDHDNRIFALEQAANK